MDSLSEDQKTLLRLAQQYEATRQAPGSFAHLGLDSEVLFSRPLVDVKAMEAVMKQHRERGGD